jgi:hypothetical protein
MNGSAAAYLLRFVVHNLSNHLHLLQMLVCMIGMDHLILHSNIISTKEFDHLTTRMDKVGNVVNNSVDGDFSALEALHCANGLQCWVIVDILGRDGGFGGHAVAAAGDVGVWWHGSVW